MIRIENIQPKFMYLDERFPGDETVFPNQEIKIRQYPQKVGKYGLFSCPECGQASFYNIILPCDLILSFNNEEVTIDLGKIYLGIGNIGKPFSLHFSDEDENISEEEVALFDRYSDVMYYSGYGPWCPNCGAAMGYYDTVFEDREKNRREVIFACIDCIAKSDTEPCEEKCIGCDYHYFRVREGISLDDIKKAARVIDNV